MGERAIAVAGRLKQVGLQKGDPVGVHLENSPEMVICILAIFLAGGVYIPLDPYYPEERLRYVIQKTGVNILVSDEVKPALKEVFSGIVMTTAELLAAITSPGPAVFVAGPADLAYIIFTSGSTGNPKGVTIRHDSLHNFLVWIGSELSVSPSDTFLSTTSINFDISLTELFTPLTRGGSVVLEKRSELQAPEKVETIIREMEVNMVQFVPSGLKALCDAGVPSRIKSLRTIISGGERLSKTLQDQIFSQSGANLFNLYGPTEATVYMAGWRCLRNSPMRTVPIGRPIFNAVLYILDDRMKPVPIGVTGEAYVGGMVLSEGYFGDEAQTALRFLPDPFSAKPGARIYRVGDLCRFMPGGSVEFLGRTDHQVKVRGFRIELGEVETTILRFPGVRRVIVDTHEHGDDDVRLTAFMVPEPGASVREAELREFLRLHLPSYMIPGHFLIAPAIPTLPNGKTDRKALMGLRPALHTISPPAQTQINETELQIKSIWKELLGHEAFTPDDNFFEVGGHSLLLVRMKDLASEKMGAGLSIVELFQYPTIRSLAAFLRKEKPVHDHSDIARRAAMRNKSIRQQISKRIFPGNKLI
jgi:amino acid adenylation domain-containing protein